MKIFLIVFAVFSFMLLHENSFAKKKAGNADQPVLIDSAAYLYKAGNIYLAGQPSKALFIDLKNQGLSMVINLRTDEEMKEHTAKDYNEEEFLRNELIGYAHLSVGTRYDPALVDRIAEIISGTRGKVMIHCRSAARATNVWMGWLIRYKGYSLDEAVKLGKMARYSFPLEEILDREIKMRF